MRHGRVEARASGGSRRLRCSWAGRLLAVLALCASIQAIASEPGASAAVRFRVERFKVTLTGSQTNVWREYRRDPFEVCGITASGSGQETVRFSTRRPLVLTARKVIGVRLPAGQRSMPLLSIGGNPLASFSVRGTITRSGKLDITPNSPEPCAGGDAGSPPPPPPPPPDCGTKTFTGFRLLLLYVAKGDRDYPIPAPGDVELIDPGRREDLLAFSANLSHGSPWELFKQCPVVGTSTLQETANSTLPERVLMGRARRFKVRGDRLTRHSLEGTTYSVGTKLRMTFTRLAARR